MSRRTRRRGNPVHGWLIVDKPAGLTSAAVVGKIRRLTEAAKVGHGGTLDPLATGVLPLALGEATKTVPYVMDGRKEYQFTVRWGEARTTDDGDGDITETCEIRPTRAQIDAVIPSFVGSVQQVPPAFSAVKVDGQRAYALARADKPVALTARLVRIECLELLAIHDPDHAEFRVMAGKGAYMRSLARDLALALGTVGHVSALRRTAVGPFLVNDAISLDKLLALGHSAALFEKLLPIETALDGILALVLTEAEGRSLRLGQSVPVLPVVNRSPAMEVVPGEVVCAMAGGRPVALARIKGAEICPVRVLNL